MNHAETGNPYRAPDTPIARPPGPAPRPPVYSAISLFCWVLAGFHLLAAVGFTVGFAQSSAKAGWERILPSRDGQWGILVSALLFLSTASYFSSARLLWARRGRPGLILCSMAIGMTYLTIWLVRWQLNRPH